MQQRGTRACGIQTRENRPQNLLVTTERRKDINLLLRPHKMMAPYTSVVCRCPPPTCHLILVVCVRDQGLPDKAGSPDIAEANTVLHACTSIYSSHLDATHYFLFLNHFLHHPPSCLSPSSLALFLFAHKPLWSSSSLLPSMLSGMLSYLFLNSLLKSLELCLQYPL